MKTENEACAKTQDVPTDGRDPHNDECLCKAEASVSCLLTDSCLRPILIEDERCRAM